MNMQRWLGVALASFVFVGCATAPEEDPLFIRMNDLDARVQRIERVLTNQSLLELAQRIDALQADLRTIRGEVELRRRENWVSRWALGVSMIALLVSVLAFFAKAQT